MENTVSDITEPVLVPEDYETVGAGMNLRLLTMPLRYRGIGTGSMVTAAAFDRLRDAYLKTQDNMYLDKCGICGGDVLSQQQFLRTEGEGQFPILTHMLCEERSTTKKLQSDLNMAETKIRIQSRELQATRKMLIEVGGLAQTAVSKIAEEAKNAITQGEEQSRNISEHPFRGDSGQTTEASRGNSPIQSGPGEGESVVQTRQRSVGYDIDGYEVQWMNTDKMWVRTGRMKPSSFRLDDVIGNLDGMTKYKWPPDFKKFDDGHTMFTVQPHVFNYEVSSPTKDTIHCNSDRVGASCE